jgi:cytochrome P450
MTVCNGSLPGPPPLPGRFAWFLCNPPVRMTNLYRRYGEIVSLQRGTNSCVFAFGPELNREVLTSPHLANLDASSSPLRPPPHSSLARLFTGLTQMNGERHKHQRRLLAPALQKIFFEQYRNDIVDVTNRKLAAWQIGEQRDLFKEMKGLARAIAVKTLVGLDAERGGEDLGGLLDRWVKLVFSPSVMFLPLNLPALPYRRLLRVSIELEEQLRALIHIKKCEGANGKDMLSILIGARDDDNIGLTDDELVGQTNFLFMAGHLTTASALTWTLFLLIQHPHVLNEIADACKGELHGEAPGTGQLGRLRLLDAAIKESMRLFPPVIWWGRVSTAPFCLRGHQLPAGTRVIHSAYITHRISDLFPEPSSFKPERWLSGEPDPYAYIPFSAGPRMCLGSSFAMMEMKIVLAIILQRYCIRLQSPANVNFGGAMLSEPKPGIPIWISRKDGKPVRCDVRGNVHKFVNLPT